MKRIALFVLLTVGIQSVSFADVTKLPAAHRKVLEDSSQFRLVLATTNLPPAIVALCADDSGRLAEPGQKWAATDVITDASLPRKRLIWATVSGEHYVVHYERGGRGHSFHVLVATLAKGEAKPKVVWRGVGRQLKDYAAFVEALRSGKLDDRLDYAH
jgi:hypothetical protein